MAAALRIRSGVDVPARFVPMSPSLLDTDARHRGGVAYDPTSVYDQKGAGGAPRGFSIEAPNELIDPFSGNLILTHTDLVLPGAGGLDLVLQRVYNSKIHRNYAAKATGDPARVANGLLFVPASPVGLGWYMHMGRLVGAYNGLRNDVLTQPRYYERPDGSQHPFFQFTGPGCGDEVNDICLLTKLKDNPYKLTDQPWILNTTDGRNITFDHEAFDGASVVNYATEIRDAYGNTIEIVYHDDTIPGIAGRHDYLRHFIDHIVDSYGRVVQFNYTEVVPGAVRLVSVTALGRTYRYFYSTENPWSGLRVFLTEARPPEGAPWRYEYDGLLNGDCAVNDRRWCELTKITYPQSGTIEYTYDEQMFFAQANPMAVRAIVARTIGGRDVPPGTTTYDYNRAADYSGEEHTIVTSPDDSQVVYTYFGIGAGVYNPLGLAWKAGALLQKQVRNGIGTIVQTESYDWVASSPFSTEVWGDPWIGFDIGVSVPRMQRRVLQRGGLTWIVEHTSFHDSNDQPRCTTETGDGRSRYRLRGYTNASVQQAGRLYRYLNLLTLDAMSYDAFGADACDPSQSVPVHVGAGDDVTVRTFNSQAQLIREETNGIRTDFAYQADGMLATEIRYLDRDESGDPTNGTCTSFDNYAFGIPQVERYGGAPPDCNGEIYSVTRTVNSDGTIASETNGRGITTSFGYDDVSRLTSILPPGVATIQVDYDGGTMVPQSTRRVTQGAYWVETKVDGFGRPVTKSTASGVYIQKRFDALGRMTLQSLPSYDATSLAGDTFAYDALGRVMSVTHADASSRGYAFGADLHTVTITDELSRNTVYRREAFGHPDDHRLTRVQLPGETPPTTDTYTYQVGGHLTNVNYAGRQRFVTNNFAKRIKHEFSPETNNLFNGYDPSGNLRCRDRGVDDSRCSDGNFDDEDALVRYAVDALGRVTDVTYGDGATAPVAMTYDNAGNMETMIDAVGRHVFTYTGINKVESHVSTIDGVDYVTRYAYDERGNLTGLTYPSGRHLTYDHDAGNRVIAVHDDARTYVSGIQYHANGEISRMVYGNGIVTTSGTDLLLRPDSLNAGGVVDIGYTYDGVGNVLTMTESVTGFGATMGYDNLDRLEDANGPWGNLHFDYNAAGDRTLQQLDNTFTSFIYDGFGQLASVSGGTSPSFRYDDFGNTLRRFDFNGGIFYSYDAEDRIVQVDTQDASGVRTPHAAFLYDGAGRRVVIEDLQTGTRKIYHYDHEGNLIAVSDNSGAMETEFVLLDGLTIAELDVRQIDGDADCDRNVNEDDVFIIRDCFGGPDVDAVGENPVCDAADMDGDRDVDCQDAQAALATFDEACATGDFDCDGVIDEVDYAILIAGMVGPGIASPCVTLDADTDGDLDMADFAAAQNGFVHFNKSWVSDTDGFWDEPTNWSGSTLPGPSDVVLIDRESADITVTVRRGESSCARLVSTERLTVDGGTLTVNGPIRVDNEFTLGNGLIAEATLVPGMQGQVLTLSTSSVSNSELRDVTVASDLVIPDNHTLSLTGHCVLHDSITVEPSGVLALRPGAVLDGTGTVRFSEMCGFCRLECDDATIESGIHVRGRSGFLRADFDATACINRATVIAEGTGGIVVDGSAWINEGTIEATNGAFIRFTSSGGNKITNRGLLLASPGGRLMLEHFDNDGVIRSNEGRITFSSPFVLDDTGTIERTGGTIEVESFLDLEGGTLALDAQTGSWLMSGSVARIESGTITTADTTVLGVQGTGTLWRTTVGGDLETGNSRFNIWDLVQLNGTVRLNPGPTPTGNTNRLIVDKIEFPMDGITRLSGSGTIVFDDATLPGQNRIVFDTNGNTTLVIEQGLEIRTGTGSGSINSITGNRTIRIQGTIRSGVSGHSIEIRGGTVTHEGLMEVRNGGTIIAAGHTPRNWTNDGTIIVGAGSGFSVTTTGSAETTFDQTAGGSLTIELAGVDQANRAHVSLGEPILNGTLRLVLASGFEPPVGTAFTAIEYTNATGMFSQIKGLDIGNGTSFRTTPTSTGLVLEVVGN